MAKVMGKNLLDKKSGGFIPMIILLFIILVTVAVLVFIRVMHHATK